jgi:hypothetical protein
MWLLLEEGRSHNGFEHKPAKWIAHCKKKKTIKYTPTPILYDFAKRSGH